MINTNELRRGNIICASEDDDGNPEPCKVFEIYEEGIRWGLLNDDYGGNSTTYKYLEPIPLTTELLERFGFLLESESYYKAPHYKVERIDLVYAQTLFASEVDINMKIVCVLATDKSVRRIGIKDFKYDGFCQILGSPSNIQYIHQLQNIYFFLTGKELELKNN